MNKKVDINIWGREFSLEVEYECYTGDSITKVQENALKAFMSHPEWLVNAKSMIEECCKERVMHDNENSKKDNIFSYIKPHYLLIKRDGEHPKVALMCKYRYDPEHGVAVVFSYEGEVEVGPQDIIL